MHFGFLVFTDVEELDFIGPWEMVTMWSKLLDVPPSAGRIAVGKESDDALGVAR